MKKLKKIEDIYEAALRIFAQYGYKKATVEDIAGELGLTKGALYQYAEDKEDLYHKAVIYGFTKWQKRVIDAVEKEKDIKKKFVLMCEKACIYLSEDAILKKLISSDPKIFPLSYAEDPYKEVNEYSIAFLTGIMEEGLKAGEFRDFGDTKEAAKLIFTMYKTLIIETYVLGEQELKVMLERLIKLMTQGIFQERSKTE